MDHLSVPELFHPPVNRSMTILDKSFFRTTIPTSAVTVLDRRTILKIRKTLLKTHESLNVGGLQSVVDDEIVPGTKCLVLDPKVKADEPERWSTELTELVDGGLVRVRPYSLELTYDDFSMSQILEAVLPEFPEDEKETPTGFTQTGHVAHLNLRQPYLPYKHLIGQVLADKNVGVTTVINKTLDVGTESAYRTFPYEVLVGPDDLNVTVSEGGCEFHFDFAKVYWNSRLGTEHKRLVDKFQPGEAVCDVMAGVGPFALPAGKKRVFVRANDLNPDSHTSLGANIRRNKVGDFVSAHCEDGRAFIRSETARLKDTRRTWTEPPPKVSRNAAPPTPEEKARAAQRPRQTLVEPSTFNHYVMNLPATAIEFLDAFQGIYHGREAEFDTDRKLPMVHLYTFQFKKETDQEARDELCARVSHYLGADIRSRRKRDGGNHDNTDLDKDDSPKDEIEIHSVRLVAPYKYMYCVSFRLPASVAFARPPDGSEEKTTTTTTTSPIMKG